MTHGRTGPPQPGSVLDALGHRRIRTVAGEFVPAAMQADEAHIGADQAHEAGDGLGQPFLGSGVGEAAVVGEALVRAGRLNMSG